MTRAVSDLAREYEDITVCVTVVTGQTFTGEFVSRATLPGVATLTQGDENWIDLCVAHIVGISPDGEYRLAPDA